MTAVAASHDDKAFNGTGFYSIHNLVGQGKDLIMSEAAQDGSGFKFLGRGTGFGLFNKGTKIFNAPVCSVGNMNGAVV